MDPGENHHENEKKTESCAADGGLPVGMAGGRGLSARQLALADASGARAAAGKGKFTVETAALEPDVLFVAVERVQEALVLAMEKALSMGLRNVYFLSIDAAKLEEYFAPGEVDLIYLNFCDPWPRKKNAKRRLTFHTFLKSYQRVLRLNGEIHFKTDNAPLFEWSLGEFEACGLEIRNLTRNLHENGPVGIMTGYEEKFYALGTPINRCELINHGVLPDPEPAEKDEQTGIL